MPTHKIELSIENVVEVKNVVDAIVTSILGSMNKETRMATENYILKEAHIPFVVLETGDLVIGKSDLA